MTDPVPDIPIKYSPASVGCTAKGCGVQDTIVLCPRFGRRCAEHIPPFDPSHAARLATTDLGAAIDYLRGSGRLAA